MYKQLHYIYLWFNTLKKETLLHCDSPLPTATLQCLINVPSPFIWKLLTQIWSNNDVKNARSCQVMILYLDYVYRITSDVQTLILDLVSPPRLISVDHLSPPFIKTPPIYQKRLTSKLKRKFLSSLIFHNDCQTQFTPYSRNFAHYKAIIRGIMHIIRRLIEKLRP